MLSEEKPSPSPPGPANKSTICIGITYLTARAILLEQGIKKRRRTSMTDVVSPSVRSRMMASIRGRDTQPEMMVRKYLHGCGFRYRLHVNSLPGRPDIVLSKYRVAILIHGCFWHRHSGCKYCTTPASNIEKWSEKFFANVARDHKNTVQLRELGWTVIVIWECGLKTGDLVDNLKWLPEVLKSGESGLYEWPRPSNIS